MATPSVPIAAATRSATSAAMAGFEPSAQFTTPARIVGAPLTAKRARPILSDECIHEKVVHG